jgi:hypothetical protein
MAINAGESTIINFGGAIAQVLSISGPTESRPEVSTTSLDDTAQTFRFGLKDGGEVSVEIQYDSSSHVGLHGMLSDTTATATTITLVDVDGSTNESITFNSFLTGWDLSGMEVEGNVTASLTFKVSGDVTY